MVFSSKKGYTANAEFGEQTHRDIGLALHGDCFCRYRCGIPCITLNIRVCTSLAALLTFGLQVTAEFNHINGLDLVCRAHQLVQEGLKYMFTGAWLLCAGTCCASLVSLLLHAE